MMVQLPTSNFQRAVVRRNATFELPSGIRRGRGAEHRHEEAALTPAMTINSFRTQRSARRLRDFPVLLETRDFYALLRLRFVRCGGGMDLVPRIRRG